MQLAFFDTPESWERLLPLSYTRPVADMRVGILKIHEKWTKLMSAEQIYFRSQDYLTPLFSTHKEKCLSLLGNVLPSENLVEALKQLDEGDALVCNDELIAGYFDSSEPLELGQRKAIEIAKPSQICYPWDIFRLNGQEIRNDYRLLTHSKQSQAILDPYTKTYGGDIFIEEGAKIKATIINAEAGPVYIGKHAELQEGSLIRGPFALCEHSVINMGAKIRGDTTIGPFAKVGGEVSNSVIFGYSNKGHEGFLGNSVLGEWCNLGADTNNSNLKNNYANVKMWDFHTQGFLDTGLQFCGLIMGDHSKSGINTMFNTGTTVGVSSNIYGHGFPPTMISSFAWGGASGFTSYRLEKAFETAELMMKRRNKSFTEVDKGVLSHIFEITSKHRVWEKE